MTYGLFRCEHCAGDPGETCSDFCACEWPAELPPLWMNPSSCPCCGRDAQLVAQLVPAA
jgi:hypothetical protein